MSPSDPVKIETEEDLKKLPAGWSAGSPESQNTVRFIIKDNLGLYDTTCQSRISSWRWGCLAWVNIVVIPIIMVFHHDVLMAFAFMALQLCMYCLSFD